MGRRSIELAMTRMGWAASILMIALAFLAAHAADARAVESHVLDAARSLTGGSDTSTLDPIPDPGNKHPKKHFNDPCGVATDRFGDVYVANGASSTSHEEEGETRFDGRIDVFSPDGNFITEVTDLHFPCSLAITANGVLYLEEFWTGNVVRYNPSVYLPSSEEIEYTAPVFEVFEVPGVFGISLNPANDHLYLTRQSNEDWIEDWTKEKGEGFPETNRFGKGEASNLHGIDIWGENGDIAVSGTSAGMPLVGRAFVFDGGSGVLKQTLDGQATPDNGFGFDFGSASVAIDQENGDVYVADLSIHHAVDQFAAPGPGEEATEQYIGQIKLGNNGLLNSEPISDVAVDSSCALHEPPLTELTTPSCKEFDPSNGYVYVTSGFQQNNSHLYAFAPFKAKPPEVRGEHVDEVGESDALLVGEVNPNGAVTSYNFEYGLGDCVSGSCQSIPAPAGDAGSGSSFRSVYAQIAGLIPGSTYHFRLTATSHCNPADPSEECVVHGADTTFTAFPAQPEQVCPNDDMRVGHSAVLPDCRAYELVTPPETNGRVPTATLFGEGADSPGVLLASPSGENLIFGTEGGAIPGIGGGGFHDAYVATRESGGWHTEFTGLDGAQAQRPFAAGTSPDHAYSFWEVDGEKGSLANPSQPNVGTSYLRGPGGSIEPVGSGSLGIDSEAKGNQIRPGAGDIVFSTGKLGSFAVQLEPNAPPEGTAAIYDRAPGGPTHVVSLLPGDKTPATGESAVYLGTAGQSSDVAFEIGSTIYERIADTKTVKIIEGPASFGGISADGGRVFYVKDGDIFSFNSEEATTKPIGSGGQSTLVNVSEDGSHAYFASPLVLTGKEKNSKGAKALLGGQNLYVWDASSETVHFIATVEEMDIVGELPPVGGTEAKIGGLGLWVADAVAPRQDQFQGPANDPSRTNPAGNIFVFESRAKLTDYENKNHSEIYRYDASQHELLCISCNPTGGSPTSEARLESRYASRLHSIPPVNAISLINNVTTAGNRIFFETTDALAVGDTDQTSDVYEWETDGTAGCELPVGCILLISSGHSATPNYLYGVGEDGRDVFFWTGDELVPQDQSDAPSVYDARVDGGFAAPLRRVPCQGEACQGAVARLPSLAAPVNVLADHKPRRNDRHRHKKRHRSKPGKASSKRNGHHHDRGAH